MTENHTRIYLEGGTVVNVAVHGGFVEVSNNKVSILSDVAELGDQIDVGPGPGGPGPGRGGAAAGPDRRGRGRPHRAEARLAAAGRS